MIIVKLWGGLGNQMFQYSLARNLAEKNLSILKMDIHFLEQYEKTRKYDLGCFLISEHLASIEEVYIFSNEKNRVTNFINRLFNKASSVLGLNSFVNSRYFKDCVVIREKDFSKFDPNILEARGNIYLEGCWQSEKYFADIKDIIKNEFTVKYFQNLYSRRMSKLIAEKNAVSLHFRRGDYIDNNLTCPLNYYTKAISYIASKVDDPHFFVFSDDHEWIKSNFKIYYPFTEVDQNDHSKNYEDLRLISQCRHHIIANSTFSWWGAWLSDYPKKIVVAPKVWFAKNEVYSDDICPENWVLL
jgi:hypothetical protein